MKAHKNHVFSYKFLEILKKSYFQAEKLIFKIFEKPFDNDSVFFCGMLPDPEQAQVPPQTHHNLYGAILRKKKFQLF